MIKKYLNYGLIIFSVVVCLGGAVNSGMTRFWLASPFAFFLIFYFLKQKKILMFVIGFIVLCITINLTQDKNPLIYTKLNQKIELEESYGVWKVENQYELLHFRKDVFEEYINRQKLSGKWPPKVGIYGGSPQPYKIPAGHYNVLSVIHEGVFGEHTYYIIEVDGKKVATSENIKGGWAEMLSNVVVWPIYIMHGLNKIT